MALQNSQLQVLFLWVDIFNFLIALRLFFFFFVIFTSLNVEGLYSIIWASQVVLGVRTCLQETLREAGSIPGSGTSPGVGNANPTPVFLRGESHGQRSP